MTFLRKVLLLSCITIVLCHDTQTIRDLGDKVAAQLIELLKQYYPDIKASCSDLRPNPLVQFELYNRDHPENPIIVNPSDPVEVDHRRKHVIVIPGWLSSTKSTIIKSLIKAYIDRYNVHLIGVNYEESAFKQYNETYCDIPAIARPIGELLCNIKKKGGRLNTVQVIGHGVGAQMMSYVSQVVQEVCDSRIGRLTGLDPASHLFKNTPENERLDPSDGDLVDVIHTDGMKLGFSQVCGTVDFHPNCAYEQPGCPSLAQLDNDTVLADALCASLRSIEYYIESIGSEDFVAVSCGRCPTYCTKEIISAAYATMGEHYTPVQPPAHGKLNFFLPTNRSPPYAQGWDPYSLNVEQNPEICLNPIAVKAKSVQEACSLKMDQLS